MESFVEIGYIVNQFGLAVPNRLLAISMPMTSMTKRLVQKSILCFMVYIGLINTWVRIWAVLVLVGKPKRISFQRIINGNWKCSRSFDFLFCFILSWLICLASKPNRFKSLCLSQGICRGKWTIYVLLFWTEWIFGAYINWKMVFRNSVLPALPIFRAMLSRCFLMVKEERFRSSAISRLEFPWWMSVMIWCSRKVKSLVVRSVFMGGACLMVRVLIAPILQKI